MRMVLPVRSAMAQRKTPPSPVRWLVFRIPVGTVWSEETAYRGALATLAALGFGPRLGRLLQATVFGLSHIADARSTRGRWKPQSPALSKLRRSVA